MNSSTRVQQDIGFGYDGLSVRQMQSKKCVQNYYPIQSSGPPKCLIPLSNTFSRTLRSQPITAHRDILSYKNKYDESAASGPLRAKPATCRQKLCSLNHENSSVSDNNTDQSLSCSDLFIDDFAQTQRAISPQHRYPVRGTGYYASQQYLNDSRLSPQKLTEMSQQLTSINQKSQNLMKILNNGQIHQTVDFCGRTQSQMLKQTQQMAAVDQERLRQRRDAGAQKQQEVDMRKYDTSNADYVRILIQMKKPDPDYPAVLQALRGQRQRGGVLAQQSGAAAMRRSVISQAHSTRQSVSAQGNELYTPQLCGYIQNSEVQSPIKQQISNESSTNFFVTEKGDYLCSPVLAGGVIRELSTVD